MTDIILKKTIVADAEEIWQMQKKAFQELLEKYRDFDTNPASESLEKTVMRLNQPFTFFYFIELNGVKIGAIRVVDKKTSDEPKRISPLFIMPQYRNKGYAQAAIKAVEAIHGEKFGSWILYCRKQQIVIYTKKQYITTRIKQSKS